jgi:hypothetical protein
MQDKVLVWHSCDLMHVQSGEVFKILGGVFGGMKAFRERDMAFPG